MQHKNNSSFPFCVLCSILVSWCARLRSHYEFFRIVSVSACLWFDFSKSLSVSMCIAINTLKWEGAAGGDQGMQPGLCPIRGESAPMDDLKKSLITQNFFRDDPNVDLACLDNSDNLYDMLEVCAKAAGNRWTNFLAVDYYKVPDSRITFNLVGSICKFDCCFIYNVEFLPCTPQDGLKLC